MTRVVGIVGLGNVGGAVANALVLAGLCDELILFDCNLPKAVAQAIDISDMLACTTHFTKVGATDSVMELAGADLLINCLGPDGVLEEDRLEELAISGAAVTRLFPQIMAAGFAGIIMNITNPCDVITALIQEVTKLPPHRVFGTGTALDTARMRRIVATAFGVAPRDVSGYVLGEHGNSQFVAWSTVSINSFPLTQINKELALAGNLAVLEDTIRNTGWDIIIGKNHTCFGIAATALRIVQALFTNEPVILPLCVFDLRSNCYIGLPAKLTKEGIISLVLPVLNSAEELNFEQSLAIVKNALVTFKDGL
ncbi:MAG: lactate/malate family dehydrogenase [Culicoidibacterales bacterium]